MLNIWSNQPLHLQLIHQADYIDHHYLHWSQLLSIMKWNFSKFLSKILVCGKSRALLTHKNRLAPVSLHVVSLSVSVLDGPDASVEHTTSTSFSVKSLFPLKAHFWIFPFGQPLSRWRETSCPSRSALVGNIFFAVYNLYLSSEFSYIRQCFCFTSVLQVIYFQF